MPSISSSTSGVNLSSRASARTFSYTCSGELAPMMADETFSFLMTHASASVLILTPSLSAMGVSLFTVSTQPWKTSPAVRLTKELMNSICVCAKRELLGMPSLYLPERMPCFSGEKTVVPRPISRYRWRNSPSTFSRSL